jgi:hypothetical protein
VNKVRQVSEKNNIKQQKVCVIITKENFYAFFPFQLIKNLFLPFVAFTMHDHVNAPVKQSPLLLKTCYPVGAIVVLSTTFVFVCNDEEGKVDETSFERQNFY